MSGARGGRMPVALARAIAFAAGATLSAQAFVNGRFGASLDAPAMAACVSQLVGLATLLAIGGAGGALGRALARLRAGARPRAWHVLGCCGGALLVIISTIAAPVVGVALLTVGLVAGQTLGSLGADAAGLSPAGRRPITPARLGGVALAIAAVGLGAVGARAAVDPWLLALAVLGGAGLALSQAAMGWLTETTGEPAVAATISFATAVPPLAVAVVALGAWPATWSAAWPLWLGGALGAGVGLSLAATVGTLGVLRVTLMVVAGQAAGGLAIDLLAPAAAGAVTARTVASVLLTFAAVAIGGGALRRRGAGGGPAGGGPARRDPARRSYR